MYLLKKALYIIENEHIRDLSYLIPSPNRTIVTDAKQNIGIPAQTSLSNGSVTTWVLQSITTCLARIQHVHVPDEHLSSLISEC